MYTSGNFFQRKDLAAYMKKAFSDEIAKEALKDEAQKRLEQKPAASPTVGMFDLEVEAPRPAQEVRRSSGGPPPPPPPPPPRPSRTTIPSAAPAPPPTSHVAVSSPPSSKQTLLGVAAMSGQPAALQALPPDLESG